MTAEVAHLVHRLERLPTEPRGYGLFGSNLPEPTSRLISLTLASMARLGFLAQASNPTTTTTTAKAAAPIARG